VSCRATSNPALDKTIPVIPPIVNKNKNPTAKKKGVRHLITPPHIVAIQLKTFIPVGTPITMVAAIKYALVSTSKPTVYM
jgi:hypothetical protein